MAETFRDLWLRPPDELVAQLDLAAAARRVERAHLCRLLLESWVSVESPTPALIASGSGRIRVLLRADSLRKLRSTAALRDLSPQALAMSILADRCPSPADLLASVIESTPVPKPPR